MNEMAIYRQLRRLPTSDGSDDFLFADNSGIVSSLVYKLFLNCCVVFAVRRLRQS